MALNPLGPFENNNNIYTGHTGYTLCAGGKKENWYHFRLSTHQSVATFVRLKSTYISRKARIPLCMICTGKDRGCALIPLKRLILVLRSFILSEISRTHKCV